MKQEQLEGFFQEHKPARVVELISLEAINYVRNSEHVPPIDRERFEMLHDIRELALQQLSTKGASHE